MSCDACPVIGRPCVVEWTRHTRLCGLVAADPARWVPLVVARSLDGPPVDAGPPARPAPVELLRLLHRARHCPHRRPCGCATFDCSIGRGTLLDGRATLDDCKACPIARGLILEDLRCSP